MLFTPTKLAGAFIIDVEKRCDERGFFSRTWCIEEFAAQGLDARPVQCSMSHNPVAGTLRGLHYQAAPHLETKLVRCTSGAVFDVIADVRPASATWGEWLGVELSAANGRMLWVPEGCAHGFLTLLPDTDLTYQTSAPHAPAAERALSWNDPAFAIAWPAQPRLLSAKDARIKHHSYRTA